MKRDLKELTMESMLERHKIDFYKRKINMSKCDSSKPNKICYDELELLQEQELSDELEYIANMLLVEDEFVKTIWFDNPFTVTMERVKCDCGPVKAFVPDLEKKFRKWLDEYGVSTDKYILAQSNVTGFWEFKLIKEWEFMGGICFSRPYLFRLVAEVVQYLKLQE